MRSRALTLARVAARAVLCSGGATRPTAPWNRLQQRRHSSWLAASTSAAADGKNAAVDVENGNNNSNNKPATSRRPKHVRLPAHWSCPACGTRCVRPAVFARHLRSCCPDIVSPEAWRAATRNAEAGVVVDFSPSSDSDPAPSLDPDAIAEAEDLLEEARRAEEALREKILVLSFRTLPPPPKSSSSSTPPPPPFSRMPVADVARRLRLPEKRVAASLKAAVRATPLVADDASDDNEGTPSPVIFEDDEVLAFSKPSGIITAPKHRHEGGSLVARAIAHLNKGGDAKKDAKVPLRTPFPVHRLDMSTSGVVVMAKSSSAAAALQRQFRLRTARKVYLALVAGKKDGNSKETWAVDAAIGRHPALKVGRRVVVGGSSGNGSRDDDDDERNNNSSNSSSDGGGEQETAQHALTRFVVLSQCDGSAVESALRRTKSSASPFSSLFSLGALAAPGETEDALRNGAALLACAPRTGRTHQIRVHAQFCGLPILGDELYGPVFAVDDHEKVAGGAAEEKGQPLAPRLLLHAAALELEHPSSPEPLRLSAPLPEEFKRAMRALGLEEPPRDLFKVLPRSLWE